MAHRQAALEKNSPFFEPYARTTPAIRDTVELEKKYRRHSAQIKVIALTVFALGAIAAASVKIFWPHGDGLHTLVVWAGELLEHLTFALAVSGVAVFGYEKLTHARESFEAIEYMKLSTKEHEDAREALQESLKLTNSLKELQESIHELRRSEAKQAVSNGLETLLGDDRRALKLKDHILEIVEAGAAIRRTRVEFIAFLTWFIDLGLRENLSDLAKVMSDGRGYGTFKLKVTAVEVVGRVFGTLMKLLGEGSSYDSISRLHIWRSDKFRYYYSKTEKAVGNGVTIRRVFNVCGLKARGSTPEEKEEDVKQIVSALRMHLELNKKYPFEKWVESSSPGYYETRIFGNEELDKISGDLVKRAAFVRSLMGFFRIKEAPNKIRRIQFSAAPNTANLTELSYGHFDEDSGDVKMFEQMWEASKDSPLTEDRIRFIEKQLKAEAGIS